MSPRFKRSDRVADLIHREISFLLLRRIKDPRLEQVTLTGVKLSDDLRNATVFYTTREQSRRRVDEGLQSACSLIRREIGRNLHLRYTPELRFQYDDSMDRAQRIEEILKEIKGGLETDD